MPQEKRTKCGYGLPSERNIAVCQRHTSRDSIYSLVNNIVRNVVEIAKLADFAQLRGYISRAENNSPARGDVQIRREQWKSSTPWLGFSPPLAANIAQEVDSFPGCSGKRGGAGTGRPRALFTLRRLQAAKRLRGRRLPGLPSSRPQNSQ